MNPLQWICGAILLIVYGSILSFYLAKSATVGVLRGKQAFLRMEQQNGEDKTGA